MSGIVHLFLLRGGLHWLYGGQSLERLKSGGERRGIIHSLCAQSALEITQGNETADRRERLEGGSAERKMSINPHKEIKRSDLVSC